jgi:protein arginine kinase activator
MKRCSRCDGASVVELTQIEAGEVTKVPLCAKCAAEAGIQTPGAHADTPLGSLLAALGGEDLLKTDPNAVADVRCEGCGATLEDFRKTGRLGCESCYTTFDEPLRELLRRLHGSTVHSGKVHRPAAGVAPPPPTEGPHLLQERLRKAIASEQFELAAQLRDQLRRQP